MEVVRANGLEIAYERVGEGPPLVLVHGAAVDSRMWGPQLAALADEFTVVAWDDPGAGRSSDVPGDYGLADYAYCLAALIGALDLGPAHVAGLSWGGTVAQELYRHHPELVGTLLLVDTYAGWKESLPEEEVRVRFEGVRPVWKPGIARAIGGDQRDRAAAVVRTGPSSGSENETEHPPLASAPSVKQQRAPTEATSAYSRRSSKAAISRGIPVAQPDG